jgi:flagellar hook-associated protein 1 FlgK
MSGILGLMDIAKRALAAQQLGVEVTSHNISNVDTPGFSRQIVYLETSLALPSPYGPLGFGVQVTGIERAFNSFIVARLDQNSAYLGEYKTIKSNLDQVASLFNETQATGMTDLFSGFWDAWHDLADNPSGSGERQSLITLAENLGDAFASRADQLVQSRNAITQQLGPTIQKINNLSAEIAQLNGEIVSLEVNGEMANDLRDQRNLALNQLSELAGISYYTTGDGTISVTLPNGSSLVEGVNSWDLDYTITAADTVTINWVGPGGTVQDVTSSLRGGELSALVQVRDTLIPGYQSDLDDIAKELIAQINSRHSQGVGLDLFSSATSSNFVTTAELGNPLINNPSLAFGDRITAGTFVVHVEDSTAGTSTPTTITIAAGTTLASLAADLNAIAGISAAVVTSGNENRLEITADAANFTFGFSQDNSNALMALGVNTFFKGDSAWTIGVNDDVASDPNLIAAGTIDPTTYAHPPGDNSNALLLAEMGEQPVGPGGLPFSAAYQQFVTNIGLDTEDAGNKESYYQGLVDQFTEMRNSVSGVSLDEELTNLIKFQRAYQAAAKMVTTADELLETLLSLKK